MKEVDTIFIAAHELKSPLALMRQLALGLDSDNLAKNRRQIINVSERAMKQVNDLVKVARLEDGLFEMEPVSVRAVCDDVTRELRDLYRANHRTLDTRYHNKAHLVTANRDLLYSVIYNFCSNALHYSDQDSAATLTVRETAGRLHIGVRDFGPALPINIWNDLKKGWLDSPTSIAMRPGSSGLGLYIASKFSRYMGGTIGATRHRDGTSFFVELPISHQASIFDLSSALSPSFSSGGEAS